MLLVGQRHTSSARDPTSHQRRHAVLVRHSVGKRFARIARSVFNLASMNLLPRHATLCPQWAATRLSGQACRSAMATGLTFVEARGHHPVTNLRKRLRAVARSCKDVHTLANGLNDPRHLLATKPTSWLRRDGCRQLLVVRSLGLLI
jgi:hypothetical protein